MKTSPLLLREPTSCAGTEIVRCCCRTTDSASFAPREEGGGRLVGAAIRHRPCAVGRRPLLSSRSGGREGREAMSCLWGV